jgi:hypothetical protein
LNKALACFKESATSKATRFIGAEVKFNILM